MGVALLGLAAYAVINFSDKVSRYKSYIEFLDQKEQVRTAVKSTISCQQTFDGITSKASGRIETCPAGPIVLKDLNGNDLGSQPNHPGFREGYRFRASCSSETVTIGGKQVTNKAVGIQVDVQILNAQGQPKHHPLTSRPLDFNHEALSGFMGTQTSSPICPELFLITPRAFERTVDIEAEVSKPDVAAALLAAEQLTSIHGTLQDSCSDINSGDGLWAMAPAPNFHAGVERFARFDRFCETFCTHDEGLNYFVGVWQYCGGPSVVPVPGSPIGSIDPNSITCLCIR